MNAIVAKRCYCNNNCSSDNASPDFTMTTLHLLALSARTIPIHTNLHALHEDYPPSCFRIILSAHQDHIVQRNPSLTMAPLKRPEKKKATAHVITSGERGKESWNGANDNDSVSFDPYAKLLCPLPQQFPAKLNSLHKHHHHHPPTAPLQEDALPNTYPFTT